MFTGRDSVVVIVVVVGSDVVVVEVVITILLRKSEGRRKQKEDGKSLFAWITELLVVGRGGRCSPSVYWS